MLTEVEAEHPGVAAAPVEVDGQVEPGEPAAETGLGERTRGITSDHVVVVGIAVGLIAPLLDHGEVDPGGLAGHDFHMGDHHDATPSGDRWITTTATSARSAATIHPGKRLAPRGSPPGARPR